ncbi:MAG: DUF3596 domain-containing protein, partial [Zoogloea sp.]|nr:DUF3596 domain-containing protein [Zoogloea sp.]
MASIRARADSGKLFFDFRFRGLRCREQTLLDDTPTNRKKLEKVLQRIEVEIAQGTFDYAEFFPSSNLASKFSGAASISSDGGSQMVAAPMPAITGMPLQSVAATSVMAVPASVAARPSFADFAETWQLENEVTWRRSYQRTVSDIVAKHLVPRFGARDVGSLLREELLKLRSELAKVKGRKKETLSPRRINAIMNVMSLILAEASDRYKFTSPYYNIKPLRLPKSDVEPFMRGSMACPGEPPADQTCGHPLVR